MLYGHREYALSIIDEICGASLSDDAVFCINKLKWGRNDIMQEILKKFREKSSEFAERHKLNTMETELKYKGQDNGLEIRFPFEKFTMSFVWMYRGNHSADFSHKHMLSCRLYFDDEIPLYCLLYDIMDLLDENDFRCYFFPYIESHDRFAVCLDVILSAADKYLPRIIELADDDVMRRMIISRVRRDVCAIVENNGLFEFSEDDSEVRLSNEIKPDYLEKCIEMYHAGVRVMFGGEAYGCYLRGEYSKALKSFAALKNHTYYEKRLINFISELMESGSSYDAVDDKANSLYYGMSSHEGYSIVRRVALICALSLPLITLGYMGEYYLTVFFTTGENIIYNTAMMLSNSILPCMRAGAIGMVMLGYLLWRNPQKTYFGKKSKGKTNTLAEQMLVRKYERIRPAMKRIANILYIVSVWYVALTACGGYLFDEYGFYDRNGLLCIQGVYYDYDEVDEIREVEHGKLLWKTTGYSFKMHDGTVIEIDCDTQSDEIDRLKEIWISEGIEVIPLS